jgi:hypothetical protein
MKVDIYAPELEIKSVAYLTVPPFHFSSRITQNSTQL